LRNRYGLADEVYVCRSGERFVFLDAAQDRYLILKDRQSEWLTEILCPKPPTVPLTDKSEAFAVRLCELGLLSKNVQRGCGEYPPVPPPHAAYDNILEDKTQKYPCKARLRFFRAFSQAVWLERTCGLSNMLKMAAAWKNDVTPDHNVCLQIALNHTNAFHRITPFVFSSHDACRWRSLVLFRYLTLCGIRPEWVYAVRTRPFAAHCWIEFDGVVLNDQLEKVRPYTPIMVI